MTALSTELATLDATAQADLVRRGEVSPAELVAAAVGRIEALNPAVNAVITPMPDAPPPVDGPFAGVPFLVKDLVVEVAGTRFSEGSVFLRDNVSTQDSLLVTRLRRAGLVLIGKTNTPEFGMVPTCEPALHGATRNPWDLTRSTSGSSGGSAAAVASGMVPMAHGNDLGGSLRFPASACGLFGLKPTRARNPLGPLYGDAVSGWATDHALTRSVRDSAALLDATSGPAPGDPYPAPAPSRPFLSEVGRDPGRLRIAYTPRVPDGSLGHPDCLAALDDAVALCASLGHELVEADLPGLTPPVGNAIGTVFMAATAWIADYWVRRVGRTPAEGELEPLTRTYWEAGRGVTAGQYLLAITDLQAFSRTVAEFLGTYDLWLTPTMSSPPALLGEISGLDHGASTVAYPAVVANITGNPAMSVPLWWNRSGLPIGVHFLGRFGDEATLFRLASQLEAARPWQSRLPVIRSRRPAEDTGRRGS
ncbi:MAG TPA: amidase [Lentzea sp.]